ncbi:type II toxin-antitoxin system RelB/DinJ family antitoxin [Roseibium litorale]|uniref:Type II toxin-antitoxin system RelB/DinJ family antitoxin n=1 Tax=Roseibium litorale TaxID=2803841 RepID=A0ABR9CS28_9HYPH|nr:type II toxin-antitoxin system RelB/DinJ family antitoxin [Roseibium litorale]MBD8893568.1 type II toxin-antitoxin system RelB/DinJ family antitoxin [Roseibium litorale]
MATQTSMLHVRVDDELKSAATETLSNFGLTLSDAVRILLTRVVKEGSLPVGLIVDEDAYDEWFRLKVSEALNRREPSSPHAEVMQRLRSSIDE